MSEAVSFSSVQPLTPTDATKFQVMADRISQSKDTQEKLKSGELTLEKLCSESGVTIPAGGWHTHFVDENNSYYPSEADAGVQIESMKPGELWNRAEFRYGSGKIACTICLWCSSK
jgi:hypothetical protein